VAELEWEMGTWRDLLTGTEIEAGGFLLPGHGFYWLKKIS